LWWEEGFCRMLADGGRFVIRYDHRDTGRSVTYEPGHPEYTGADLVADAVGVLDAYEIQSAHVVGVSAGGAFAQLLALGFPDRVLSLVLISTSPAKPVKRTREKRRFHAPAHSSDERFDRRIRGRTRRVAPLGRGERGRGVQALDPRLGLGRGCSLDGSGHVRGDGRLLADIDERVRAADERDPHGCLLEDAGRR